MNYWFYISKLLAGVGVFILGMNFIEEALHKVAGRPFKLFLKKQTSNNLKAIGGGALVTGVLQSSSIVNMMVLAFVSTGVLTMQKALAVILGDNLGTTVDSWFYATAGFNLNIESLAFSIIGVAGIVIIVFNKRNKWYQWGRFFFGIGFLFLGLDFMKTGMMDMVQKIDLRYLANYSPVIFLLVGLLITSLIQSSSATIAILLSALYANAINLNSATAMVLGAEIGTTLKFILVSINGSAAQKRVALGNFLFNVIVSILVLLFLGPVNYFITVIIGIKNNLLALVFFQSLINLGGIILFYPFLHPFANLLEKFFRKKDENTFFVQKVTANNIDLALASFEKETRYFMEYAINYCTNIFGIVLPGEKITLSKKFINNTQEGKYDFVKHLHGKLLSDYIELQNVSSAKEEAIKSGQLISAVRNSMYAAKSMKDSLYDAGTLRNSSNDAKYDFYVQAAKRTEAFYLNVTQILEIKNSLEYFDELVVLQKNIQDGYTQTLHSLYKKSFMASLNEIEISSLINFNREVYTSYKSMVLSLKDFLLSEKEAEYFDGLPGFIN